jgi:hypothetical protein
MITYIGHINIWNHFLYSIIHNAIRLLLREEHRLRVFENRVLRRIFGPKTDEVTGGWRKLYNGEQLVLFSKYN